jgi:hypothetical protein
MTAFNVAWRTRRGRAPHYDTYDVFGEPPAALVFARLGAALEAFYDRHQALSHAGTAPRIILRALSPEAFLCVALNASALILTCAAAEEVLHYFRFADATLKPLSDQPGPLAFSPGDTYIALTPGVRRIADGPTVARFLHMRDDFNAEKLADALLDHLMEMAGVDELPEDITALVIEAR